MKILFLSSELAPLSKTGGLADVAGALPQAMAELGHEVLAVTPFFGSISRERFRFEPTGHDVHVELPAGRRAMPVWEWCPEPAVPGFRVCLVEDPGLFNRPQLYAEGGREYPDNALRFAYYCLAALEAARQLEFQPDIIHCNDWQTGLVPVYLKRLPALMGQPFFRHSKTLLSIHNISYQGIYPKYLIYQLGLIWEVFSPEELEFFDQINLLKGGLVHADALTTVSPQYAREIQTPHYGCGLDGLLRSRAGELTGILNGIDVNVWDPAGDPLIPAPYAAGQMKNKSVCKQELQQRFGLPGEGKGAAARRRPLLAMISRLANQKGLDLLTEILPDLLAEETQFVLLGTGQPEYHTYFRKLAEDFPGQVGVELGFDETLAHQIEAGADIFLMPSQFEPCGLNQLYSLRYGTIPVVRRTGGLADSITDATPSALAAGRATGFMFTHYDGESLLHAIQRAILLYRDKRSWDRLVETAMQQDFSWHRAAQEYERLMLDLVGGTP